ncbi:MAG: hypothetical protein QXG03_11790 [Halalkalicoccus sp.]
MNRRTFVSALAVPTVALAGCSDDEDDGIDDPEDHDEAEGDDPDTTDRDEEVGNGDGPDERDESDDES